MSPAKIEYGWFLCFILSLGICRSYTRKRMEFPPCAQGNKEGGKNSYTFYYIYKKKFFAKFSLCLNSSVSRATVLWLKGPRFESWSRETFFHYFIILYLKMLLLFKKWPVFFGNFINLMIIKHWKFFLVTLKKYYSSMRCGLDKEKEWPKGWL